jgi:NAD dependent epimerase/dehydratase family enzyme
MKALVAGATGPVGQAVVARLLAEGHDVAVVTRRPFLASRIFADRISIHEWHPLSEPLPRAAIEDRDGVLSLMGAPLAGGPSRDRETLAVASRAQSIRWFGDAIAHGNQRLVMTSLAIAPASPGEPLREEDAAGAQQSPLGNLVAEWESEMRALAGGGRNAAIVRLGLVASDGPVLRELARLARVGIVPNLKGSLIPAIGLEDAAAMLSGMLQQRSIHGLVHGVAPVAVKGEAVMAVLRALSPLPRPLIVPLAFLRRRLGLAVTLLGCRREIIPNVLLRAGADFAAPDPTKQLVEALADLSASRATRAPPPEPPTRPSADDTPSTGIVQA